MSNSRIDKEEGVLTPEERKFCVLIAAGYKQTPAWKIAFNKPRVKLTSASARACELAQKPRVYEQIKRLLKETRKQDLLSFGEHLRECQSDLDEARKAGNWTAVAQFQRLIGQIIGTIEHSVKVTEDRMDDEELMKRLGAHDPVMAERLKRLLAGKREFDS